MERKVPRPPRLLNNLRGCFCIGMASCFAACSSAKVSRLLGMSWGEFIVAGKRAARFAAGILWGGAVADKFRSLRPSAFFGPFPKRLPGADPLDSVPPLPLICKAVLRPGP